MKDPKCFPFISWYLGKGHVSETTLTVMVWCDDVRQESSEQLEGLVLTQEVQHLCLLMFLQKKAAQMWAWFEVVMDFFNASTN